MKTTSLGLASVPILLLLAGCGTDEYQRRLDSGVSASSATSKYTCLGPDTTVPGTPANTTVSLRFPTAMSKVEVNDARGKCPLLELPSLKATYEGSVTYRDGSKVRFYLYVCVSEGQNSNTARDWMDRARTNLPNLGEDSSTEVNKSYSTPTPEGSSVQWEEFHIKGKQNFYYTKADDTPINQDLPGTMICLCHAENNVTVALIYRFPKDFETQHNANFDSDWLNLVAGCLKIKSSG